MRNLFVIAADDHNLKWLEPLSRRLHCHFHRVLDVSDLRKQRSLPFVETLGRVMAVLEAFDGPIDGLMSYWDFPVSPIVAVLRERYARPGPSIDAVLRCEHKYHSRSLQQQVAADHVPRFRPVDPFDDDQVVRLPDNPGFPFWIKPIKAHSSQLGFRVADRHQLVRAIKATRREIGRFGGPFDEALAFGDLPREVAGVGGHWCLAEGLIGGHQCTLEGYVHRGEVHVPTIVDSVPLEGSSSFARYQYPSKLPKSVRARMRAIASRVMLAHGFDEGTFNLEMYWDEACDHIWLLEINPRASQSHTVITALVDGLSHLEATAALALGEAPAPHRHSGGPYDLAAKFFIRTKQDAFVTRVPTESEVRAVEDELDCCVQVDATEGRWLSQMPTQDSYSYALGVVHLGGRDEADLLARYQRCVSRLPFDLVDSPQAVVAAQ